MVVVALLLLVPALVLALECAASLLPRRASQLAEGARPRVVVLVPAHDEEDGLGATLDGLRAQLGPDDRISVIADNCTDGTASVARAHGAEALERTHASKRGKGYALEFGVDRLRAAPPEVVVIVDADCRLSEGALERIARLAASRGRPVQAAYLLGADRAPSPKTAVSALAVLVRNWVRPLGLHHLGLPCHLTGSGMAFPWALLADVPRMDDALAEDLLLGIELAKRGAPPLLCPEARVHSFLPEGGGAALKQRRRWEHGQLSLLFGQAPGLIARGLLLRPSLLALGLDLVVPPLALFVLLMLAAIGAFAALVVLGAGGAPAALGVACTSLALVASSVLLSWAAWGRETLPLRHLLAIPGYVLWKVPLYVSFFVRGRHKTWERTERDKKA